MGTFAQLREEEYGSFSMVVRPEYLLENGLAEKLTPMEGVQRLIMLDRYSVRDNLLKTLKVGDVVLCTVKDDPKYPTKGFGTVAEILGNEVIVSVEFPENYDTVKRPLNDIIKPLELFWEQIAYRVAKGAAEVEDESKREEVFRDFYWLLSNQYYIPGGRILYGAGSGADVTLMNCFVLPYIKDSRQGIIEHIGKATEIMSRGGGVGSNISTLRPAKALVAGVNGFSSGSVSWANYLSQLTELIIQGGSRRGAQMIAEADWHPDIIEFAICKIQNPKLLDKLAKEGRDPLIRAAAEKYLVRDAEGNPVGVADIKFMTGANISVLISDDFMEAVFNDGDWELRFPDLENFTPEQKEIYDNEWHLMGDVRKWEERGLPVKVYHKLKARALWHLFMVCARYSAEPGVIFIDRYNKESNAWYYSPIVVTNPCGKVAQFASR